MAVAMKLVWQAILIAQFSASCTDLSVLDQAEPQAALPTKALAQRWIHAASRATSSLAAGTLRLESTMPVLVEDCDDQQSGCTDADRDGLSDLWERVALHRLRPFVRMHPEEPLFVDYYGKVVAAARVMRSGDSHIRILMPILFSNDYGRCSATEHRGDTERVAIDLVQVNSHTVEIAGVYTASHEGTILDGSLLLGTENIGDLEFAMDERIQMPRWVVYSSIGKHALYPTAKACAEKGWGLCITDDCATPSDGRNDLLPDVYNIGEPDSPDFNFEGSMGGDQRREPTPSPTREQIWGTEEYCGDIPDGAAGSYSGSCAGPIRTKLLEDPFD